jgi:hypothetical protein
VILRSLSNCLYLFLRKPTTQFPVGKNDACRIGVMVLASESKARVVIRRNRIYHFGIYLKRLGYLGTAFDYLVGVVAAVSTIETIV